MSPRLLVVLCLAVASPCVAQPRIPLAEAIKNGNYALVSSLIANQPVTKIVFPGDRTPLQLAAHLGQREIAKLLLTRGARIDATDDYGDNALTLAATNGDGPLIQILLEAGANANTTRPGGETALMLAASAGSRDGVKALLAKGANIDAKESVRGQSALMWAAAEGHPDVVEALLQSGADVRAASTAGFTPLVFATTKNDPASVHALLAAGGDANQILPSGKRVLSIAAATRSIQAALALLEGGADPTLADGNGDTPLHAAAQSGSVQLVDALLRRGANPNAKGQRMARPVVFKVGLSSALPPENGLTPLLVAAEANQPAIMRMLVAAGADPAAKTDEGVNLLMASARTTIGTVKYAYELAPEVDAVTTGGITVMHAAVGGGTSSRSQDDVCDVIRFLAVKGAKLDELDAGGRTAMAMADTSPIDKAVDLLIELIKASGSTPRVPSKR